jgi:hypothetical protein
MDIKKDFHWPVIIKQEIYKLHSHTWDNQKRKYMEDQIKDRINSDKTYLKKSN